MEELSKLIEDSDDIWEDIKRKFPDYINEDFSYIVLNAIKENPISDIDGDRWEEIYKLPLSFVIPMLLCIYDPPPYEKSYREYLLTLTKKKRYEYYMHEIRNHLLIDEVLLRIVLWENLSPELLDNLQHYGKHEEQFLNENINVPILEEILEMKNRDAFWHIVNKYPEDFNLMFVLDHIDKNWYIDPVNLLNVKHGIKEVLINSVFGGKLKFALHLIKNDLGKYFKWIYDKFRREDDKYETITDFVNYGLSIDFVKNALGDNDPVLQEWLRTIDI